MLRSLVKVIVIFDEKERKMLKQYTKRFLAISQPPLLAPS